MIVDPASAFRGIGEDAPWGLAFVVAVALRFGSLFAFYRPSVTPLKVLGGLLFQVSAVGPPLLFFATTLWLSARASNLGVKWRVVFSIVTHVYVAVTVLTIAIASVAGALLPESVDVDLRDPPFTNLGFLAGEAASHVLRRVLEEIDVRSAYALLLVSLGLRKATANGAAAAIARTVAIVAALRVLVVVAIAASR